MFSSTKKSNTAAMTTKTARKGIWGFLLGIMLFGAGMVAPSEAFARDVDVYDVLVEMGAEGGWYTIHTIEVDWDETCRVEVLSMYNALTYVDKCDALGRELIFEIEQGSGYYGYRSMHHVIFNGNHGVGYFTDSKGNRGSLKYQER